jgi:RNA polymerase sigma factor (sigma-70 family)
MSGLPVMGSRALRGSTMTRLSQATIDEASEPVDLDLATRAMLARGDRRGAITALVDAHGEAVFGFCVRVLRDRSLAEDVLQRVFLEAYRDIARFQVHSTFPAWLFGIASHRCQDALRSQRRRLHRIESNTQAAARFADPCAASSEQLERARIIAALEDCLQGLSEEARIAVLLRFQQGTSYEEMSELLETKPNTLRVRVARALPALKRCLEAKGWTHE